MGRGRSDGRMAAWIRTLGFVWALAASGSLACDSGGQSPGYLSPDSGGSQCVPDCYFKQCGVDGCGGTCGQCQPGYGCQLWQCVPVGGQPDAGTSDAPSGDLGSDAAEPADVPEPSGLDGDGDGVDDALDNCPAIYNPNQADLDQDYLGDVCDPDLDGDGVLNGLDCNPNDPTVHPGANERCGNLVDDDCDGGTDEENAWDCTDYFVDGDGDGAGTTSSGRCLCAPDSVNSVKVAGDCDDANAAISPLAPEVCDDTDNNCNLLTDEGCDDDGDGWCDADMTVVGTPAVCPHGGGDCYDYSADVHPGAVEIDGDDIDNDCDGVKAGEPGSAIDCTCATSCVGSTVDDFLCAMDMCCDNLVINKAVSSPTGANTTGAWGAITQYGSASNDLTPFQGSSYAVLSSGLYGSPSHQIGDALSGSGSAYIGGDEAYDAVEYAVTMKAPTGATGFSIDYIFMSAEYEEFIGSQYNDKFFIYLEAASTSGGARTVINFTDCSNPNAYYDTIIGGQKVCYIAINTAFSEPCTNPATNIAGTGYECDIGSSTGWLTTKWPINSDETFKLIFHIHDTSDEIYDSLVLLDNFQWEGGTFQQGTASHN